MATRTLWLGVFLERRIQEAQLLLFSPGRPGLRWLKSIPTNGSPRLDSFIGPLLKNQVLVEFCLAVLPRVAKDIFLCLGQVSFLFRRIHHLFKFFSKLPPTRAAGR